MKMTTKILALLLVSAMLLTACNETANTPSATTTTAETEPTQITAETAAAESETAAEENGGEFVDDTIVTDKSKFPTDLYGLERDNIFPDDMTAVYCYGENPWDNIECEGFTYMAEPTGISYNSIENADVFDETVPAFNGSEEKSAPAYKRYNVGDEICGLKIETAVSYFMNNGQNEGLKERYFNGGTASFSGKKELSGYLIILSEDLYAVGGVGDIVFIPDNDSQTLPLLNYDSKSKEGVFSTVVGNTYTMGGISFKNEYGIITLGNMQNYPAEMFFGVEQNKALKAKVIIDQLTMSSSVEWFSNATAVIDSVTFE